MANGHVWCAEGRLIRQALKPNKKRPVGMPGQHWMN